MPRYAVTLADDPLSEVVLVHVLLEGGEDKVIAAALKARGWTQDQVFIRLVTKEEVPDPPKDRRWVWRDPERQGSLVIDILPE